MSEKAETPTAATSPSKVENRKPVKSRYDGEISQQRRREELLDSQQRRRDELLDKIRQLEGDSSNCSDSELEDDEDFVSLVKEHKQKRLEPLEENVNDEVMDTKEAQTEANGRRNHRRRPKRVRESPCSVMMSEWLYDKPDDFEENWMGVFCPVGKRCIVVASRKKTYVFSRRHEYMGVFQSMLPGGRRLNPRDPEINQKKGVTILDCIWSESAEVFYVLDLICWNSNSCNNCDKAYRQFFLASKFEENPYLLNRTYSNPFCFLPLPTFSCEQIADVMMNSVPIFKEKVDGVLFFHKDSFYFNKVNPLCLWIYLTDVEEKLQVGVSPELLEYQFQSSKKRMPLKKLTGGNMANNKSMEVESSAT